MLDLFVDLELDVNQLYNLISLLLAQVNITDVESLIGFGPEVCADKPYMIALVATIGAFVKTDNVLVTELFKIMPLADTRPADVADQVRRYGRGEGFRSRWRRGTRSKTKESRKP